MWTEAGDAQLAGWGISRQQAEQLGMFEVQDASVPLPSCPARPGIIIPYYQPDGKLLRVNERPFARVRWLNLQQRSGFHGKVKTARYGQPQDTNVQVYFPPLTDWTRVLADYTQPLMITEGEAKAATAMLAGYTCLALGGVYSFNNRGALVKVLADAAWKGRPVAIIYDSDAATNPDVLAAEARLVEELGTQRQASVKIVRLPENGGDKVGLDDYLHANGADELDRLIDEAQALTALDAKVVALNRDCAWIEQEGKVWDTSYGMLLDKGDFVNGSRFSSLKHIVRTEKSTKAISVAESWLKHPHAQRYTQLLFRPGDEPTFATPKGPALNLWTGWNNEPGDVTPFLKLTDYLFHRETNIEARDLPLKLLAYKAQNPKIKVPLGLVLTGPQGSGKTMWLDSVREAFAPYSANIEPGALGQDFHPWLEKSVVATINELDVETMRRNAQLIMALMSDARRQLNDKFRTMREVDSPTFYMISSNYTGVGSGFTHDDRRIVSMQAPRRGPDELYDTMLAWRRSGGERHLMDWLLNADLRGWQPPRSAPMTAAKRLAYREGLSPIQLLAEDMRDSDFNSIVYWIDLAGQWAAAQELSNDPKMAAQARAVLSGLQHIQVRPWYTAEELTMVFPTVLAQVYSVKAREIWTPGGLSRTLRDSGIPFLINRDNPDGFMWQGKMRQYLVISQFSEWENAISQADFERAMKNWPTFGQTRQKARA